MSDVRNLSLYLIQRNLSLYLIQRPLQTSPGGKSKSRSPKKRNTTLWGTSQQAGPSHAISYQGDSYMDLLDNSGEFDILSEEQLAHLEARLQKQKDRRAQKGKGKGKGKGKKSREPPPPSTESAEVPNYYNNSSRAISLFFVQSWAFSGYVVNFFNNKQ